MIDEFFCHYGSAKYLFRRSTYSTICGSILFLVQFLLCFPLFVGRDGGRNPRVMGAGMKSTGGGRRGAGGRIAKGVRSWEEWEKFCNIGTIFRKRKSGRREGQTSLLSPALLLLCMVMYDNKYKTKEKIEPSMKLNNNTNCTCTATNIPRPGGLF